MLYLCQTLAEKHKKLFKFIIIMTAAVADDIQSNL